MCCEVYFKSNQLTLLLKMFASLIFVFILSLLTSAAVGDEHFATSTRDTETKHCLLPPYPDHGRYAVSNYPSATPGHVYPSVKLDVSCDYGYVNGNATDSILCVNGFWSATMPRCVPDSGFCTLEDDSKIKYLCVSLPGSLEGSQECPYLVPSGTTVRPICRSPAYFSFKALSEMQCIDGIWEYKPICKPACGVITQHRKLEGSSTNHMELPWHAVIYKVQQEGYAPTCSGSLISADKIISIARCFTYTNNLRLANSFMVAVNKMYPAYNDSRDANSQLSDVVDIKIPSSYRGVSKNVEDDIAIVVVKTPFFFHLSVRPVCLEFYNNLDRTHLTDGNFGKVARWSNQPQFSPVLNVDDFLYIQDCLNVMQKYVQPFLTYDKYCARPSNDIQFTAFNDGTGYAIFEPISQRYYLLGVVSAGFGSDSGIVIYTFTSIVKHENFIKQHCKSC